MEVPGRLVAVSREMKFDEGAFMRELAYTINNELDELQKHVIILRFVEGFSLKETESLIRTKVNHVKVIQNRGIARLRKCLHL
jgi:RNA polymerase sigma factor (sigma-70 family)